MFVIISSTQSQKERITIPRLIIIEIQKKVQRFRVAKNGTLKIQGI